MVMVKTDTLEPPALDWAVAQVEGIKTTYRYGRELVADHDRHGVELLVTIRPIYSPSTNWAQGGPLIEKHGIEVFCNLSAEQAARFKDAHPDWRACMNRGRSKHSFGTTPLSAAMRCLVASHFGDTVQVPQELVK